MAIEYIHTTPHCGNHCWKWVYQNKKGKTITKIRHHHANKKMRGWRRKSGGHNHLDKNLGVWAEKKYSDVNGKIRAAERAKDWRKEYE